MDVRSAPGGFDDFQLEAQRLKGREMPLVLAVCVDEDVEIGAVHLRESMAGKRGIFPGGRRGRQGSRSRSAAMRAGGKSTNGPLPR